MDLQTLSDRLEINDLLTRYATAVDTKDWDLFKTVFTDDAHIDYTSAGGEKGSRDDIAAWLDKSVGMFPMTQHLIANVAVDLDGDNATVRAMFFNPMGMPKGINFYVGGYYNHTLVRTADGWKSTQLIEENAWTEGEERMAEGF